MLIQARVAPGGPQLMHNVRWTMNRNRLSLFLGVALAVVGGHIVAGLDCGAIVESAADCSSTEWLVLSSATVDSEADLYRLQDDLTAVALDGVFSIPQVRACGCNEDIIRRDAISSIDVDSPEIEVLLTAEECFYQCWHQCIDELQQRFLEMIYWAESPAIRWGAIYSAVGNYDFGETGPPLDDYEKASVYVLTTVDDSVSRIVMLDAMQSLDLGRATVVSALVDNMSHDSALVLEQA